MSTHSANSIVNRIALLLNIFSIARREFTILREDRDSVLQSNHHITHHIGPRHV